EADLGKIAASILKCGWTMPLLVDENGELISGHARLRAATILELKSIPVIVARGWSEDEKRAYRVADNQLAARATWDSDLLRDELQALEFADFDLGLIGFEPDQLETILAASEASGLTDPDSVPEVPDQPTRRRMAVGKPPGWLRQQHQ
ncbi:MAG: DNA methylase, partial [Alphaproteobacteria bacterium]